MTRPAARGLPAPPSPERTRAGQTPLAFAQAIAQAYVQRGLDPAEVLAQAGLPPALMAEPAAAAALPTSIRAVQFEKLCLHAMQELDDEAPGWFARPLPWGSYGLLARACTGAPTLGEAMRRWCRYHNLLVPDVQWQMEANAEAARVRLREHAPLGAHGALREFALLSLLRNLYGLACWWVDSRLNLNAVRFAHRAPGYADVYPLLFAGPVRFDTAHTELMFHPPDLRLPLRRDDAALSAMLRRALPIMVRPYRRDRQLVQRVRQLLNAPGTPPAAQTAETLAARLAMSARTLHRQLHAEGATLQSLKDQMRLQQAKDLLLRTARPIKQVAAISGFRNEKSFARAFRQWTGQTPSAFRQTAPDAGSLPG